MGRSLLGLAVAGLLVRGREHAGHGHIWLVTHNPAFAPVPGDRGTIIGKAVAVLHRVCPGMPAACRPVPRQRPDGMQGSWQPGETGLDALDDLSCAPGTSRTFSGFVS